jgi:hypothetical protein
MGDLRQAEQAARYIVPASSRCYLAPYPGSIPLARLTPETRCR